MKRFLKVFPVFVLVILFLIFFYQSDNDVLAVNSELGICSDLFIGDSSEILDEQGDSNPETDIIKASLSQRANNLFFEMELAGKPIINSGCYKFYIDKDQDASTGDVRGELGADYFIVVCHGDYSIDDRITHDPNISEKILKYYSDENTIKIVVDSKILHEGSTVRWAVECFNDTGNDGVSDYETFQVKKYNYEVSYNVIPKSNNFDNNLVHLPLNSEIDLDVKVKQNGEYLDAGAGKLISSSNIISFDGTKVISNNNYDSIIGPVTDIAFEVSQCGVVVKDDNFRLYLGDLYSGKNHNYVIPGSVNPSDFSETSGNYPLTFGEVMEKNEVNKITDILLEKENDISGVDPIAITGYKTFINFDRRVCGAASPDYFFSLGHGCIEAVNSGYFEWWVLAHEMGHYFTLNSDSFLNITNLENNDVYVESFASLIATWAFEEIQAEVSNYELSQFAKEAIFNRAFSYSFVLGGEERVLRDLMIYEEDPDFTKLSGENRVPIFFDMFVSISNEYGPHTTRNFFKVFRKENEDNPIFDTANTDIKKHTFIIANLSAAVGDDLRSKFKAWDFPIDDSYFDYVYDKLNFCGDGVCEDWEKDSGCDDDCYVEVCQIGEVKCSPNNDISYWCIDYDDDGKNEWVVKSHCSSNEECHNGQCIEKPCEGGDCIEEIEKCEDSDGMNYFKKGIVNYTKTEDGKYIYSNWEDECVKGGYDSDKKNTIMEYYCDGQTGKYKKEYCNNGCENGKCLEAEDYTGCNSGEVRCSPNNNAYDWCIDYNDDGVNDWVLKEFCSNNEICVQGVCAGGDVSCDVDYNPVCGEDLITYSNKCVADKLGVLITKNGVCDQQLSDINTASFKLINDKLDELLVELGELRDAIKEQEARIKYLDNLKEDIGKISDTLEEAINNFITYGVDANTKKLGAGERAAVIYSYKEAFNKLPENNEELADVIKIANGRWPSFTNNDAEKKAKNEFVKIYKRIPDMNSSNDNAAVTIIAYGLRQRAENRNLESEKLGINTFKNIYKYNPSSTEDWNIMQAITYSGASRGEDTDGDFLVDDREREIGTDVNNPDTDGDGYLDGLEVLNGYSPL